jgi:hypothetical protein
VSAATGRRGDGGILTPRDGRSPAQIDADVARLQEGIRRAKAAVGDAADRLGAEHQGALAELARATRALVDYEARIPLFERDRRRYVGARTARWAAASLVAVTAFLCLALVLRWCSAWWIILIVPLLFAGLWALAGAGHRAARGGFRPRLGAGLFAAAAVITALCCADVMTGWSSPLALLAALGGLHSFRLLAPGELPPSAGGTLRGGEQ